MKESEMYAAMADWFAGNGFSVHYQEPIRIHDSDPPVECGCFVRAADTVLGYSKLIALLRLKQKLEVYDLSATELIRAGWHSGQHQEAIRLCEQLSCEAAGEEAQESADHAAEGDS